MNGIARGLHLADDDADSPSIVDIHELESRGAPGAVALLEDGLEAAGWTQQAGRWVAAPQFQ